jgi:cobalt-zinc-cadmium efflux system outer membrane protein
VISPLRKLPFAALALAWVSALPVDGGSPSADTVPLAYEQFLAKVAASNLEFSARRFDVSIAEALEAAARLWPNPELELVTERERVAEGEDAARPARGLGVVQPIELGGKRAARRAAAAAVRLAEAAHLEDFWRELELEAATAYVEALRAAEAWAEAKRAHELAADLLRATRLLFETGDIPEVDLLQMRVEERQIRGEMLAAAAEARAAAFALNEFLGLEEAETVFAPVGRLRLPEPPPTLPGLVQSALARRPDLRAARHEWEEGQAETRLARAERIPDIDLGVGFLDEREAPGEGGRSPRVRTWTISATLPLPLFDRGQHNVRAARKAELQRLQLMHHQEVRIRAEVRQAHAAFEAAQARLSQFEEEILNASREVLAAKVLAYQQGETSLLDLLEAQRTANELQTEYIDALAGSAQAWLELNAAAALPLPSPVVP